MAVTLPTFPNFSLETPPPPPPPSPIPDVTDTPVTSWTLPINVTTDVAPPPPPLWRINFFSIFIEHPATRSRTSFYLTFRVATLSLLLPAGLLGNALTVAVMRRPRMRKQTVSLTLSLLAVSDGCCLLIRGLLWVNLVSAKWGYSLPVRLDGEGVCRTVEYLFTAIHIVGSWIVVYITVERMVAILFPMKAALLCRPTTSRVVLPVCILGPFLTFSYLPVVSHYVEGVGCVTRVWPDMVVHFFLATLCVSMVPLSLIALSNLTIVLHLTCQAGRTMQQEVTSRSDHKRSETFRRVTIMVLSVSFAFLATVFPQAANAVMRILHPHWRWLNVTDDVCAVLWDVNYAINFYLYVITGCSVREELRQMLRIGRGEGQGVEDYGFGKPSAYGRPPSSLSSGGKY